MIRPLLLAAATADIRPDEKASDTSVSVLVCATRELAIRFCHGTIVLRDAQKPASSRYRRSSTRIQHRVNPHCRVLVASGLGLKAREALCADE